MRAWFGATTLIAVAALAAVTWAGPAQAASSALRGAPKAGRCYDVSGKTAQHQSALSTGTVACTKRHTLWVVRAAEVPKSVVVGQRHGQPNSKTQTYFFRICMPAIKKALGSVGLRFGLSAYRGFWFLPTKAQQHKGAHWMSCSIGLSLAHGNLVTSRKRHPAKVSGHLSNAIRQCGTRNYSETVCTTRHSYRSTYAFAVHKKLTSTSERAAANRRCPAHVSSSAWMYSSKQLAAKKFLVTCLTQTSH